MNTDTYTASANRARLRRERTKRYADLLDIAPHMAELLDRLEQATSAGLRCDDLEVVTLVSEWRDIRPYEGGA